MFALSFVVFYMFDKFSISATLGGWAVLVALLFGLVLGSIAALNRNKWPDRVIIFFTTLFVAVPSFILATLLLLVFCLELGWFGIWSTTNPSYVLPVISLALYPMSYITRLTKTSMARSCTNSGGSVKDDNCSCTSRKYA